jgi:hypothetical protein
MCWNPEWKILVRLARIWNYGDCETRKNLYEQDFIIVEREVPEDIWFIHSYIYMYMNIELAQFTKYFFHRNSDYCK